MGKGDIKTTKGKRVRGSYGITRPRKKKAVSQNNPQKVSTTSAQ